MSLVGISHPLKKSKKFFEIIIDFYFFITMAHTTQNRSKKFTKKFLFSFSLVLKQNTFMTFPNQNIKHPKTQSESQPSQNP